MTANILLVVLFISAIVISILVLLQNKSGDMGSAFGGGSNTLFGARGSADFLSRATSFTASVFFLSALALAYIYSNQGRQASDSVIQTIEQPAQPESEIPDASDLGETGTTQAASEATVTADADQTDSDVPDADAPAEDAAGDTAPGADTETDVPAVPD